MYVKVINGSIDQFPYTLLQLRRDNKNTSFPKVMAEETLNSFNVYSVVSKAIDEFNNQTHFAKADALPVLNNTVWELDYTVTAVPQEELDQKNAQLVADKRSMRDSLLAETDWMALSDVTMSDAWKTYRQALRDFPTQSNFPNIDFPAKPE